MKPVNPADLGFLLLERTNQPMHVGGMMLFQLPEDAAEDFVSQHVQRLRASDQPTAPFDQCLTKRFGTWFWRKETDFDTEYHIRHLSLPKPGRIRELLALVSQLHSNLIDRSRPLWECYVIDGVEDNRFAVYVKVHHALVDGVAAMRTMQKALSPDPSTRGAPQFWALPPKESSGKRAKPSGLEAVRKMVSSQAEMLPNVGREVFKSIRAVKNDPDYVSVFQAPNCVLNGKITGSRRFAAQDWELERIRACGKKHNATLNDVVLAMCSSALRRYLMDLNDLPDDPLIAMVPVSLRQDDSSSGNQIGMVLANLGTNNPDPLARLRTIQGSVKYMKERFSGMSQQEIMAYAGATMAFNGVTLATGLMPQWQAFNVVVSNVPGPSETLYWEGARLEGTYPVSIPVDGIALNITLNSYDGKLEFGLIACRRTLPSVQKLLQYLEEGLQELEKA